MILKNMYILNGHKDMKPVSGKVIVVEDGKIADIIDETTIPGDANVIDLEGQYLLPGLINLHVHLPSNGYPTKKKIDYKKVASLLKLGVVRAVIRQMCANNAKMQLLSGTTTIRAVGGVLNFDTEVRDKINAGKIVGPRILAADTAIGVENGHMDGSVAVAVHSAEEAAQMVRDHDSTKPDLIKLMITGGVLDAKVPGEPGDLKMPAEYVKAACDAAHELGYMVAAHVEGNEGMVVALKNGVDTIEHGGKVTDEVLDLFESTGAKLIATLSPTIPFTKMDKEVTGFSETDVLNGTALFNNMIELYKLCIERNIPVGLGTDTGCPYVTHYDMWRELYYYCKYCNVEPAFAIYSATMLNAQIAKIDDETGSIDIGKFADFMVVKKNPLKYISALQNPSSVFFKGRQIDVSRLKKNQKVEYQLEKNNR